MKRGSRLERALKDIEDLYEYYFTHKFCEQGWCPEIGFGDINDVLERIVKALLVIGKRVEKLEKEIKKKQKRKK